MTVCALIKFVNARSRERNFLIGSIDVGLIDEWLEHRCSILLIANLFVDCTVRHIQASSLLAVCLLCSAPLPNNYTITIQNHVELAYKKLAAAPRLITSPKNRK